jgi:hypothetical protein
MIEVRFPSETLAQYKVYSLCCQHLLNSYEELAAVCDIDTLVEELDKELQNSYCGDQYGLAVETLGLGLQKLINRYRSKAGAAEKLTEIHQTILEGKDEWDCYPALTALWDTGKGLAQEFYRGGNRASNIELIASRTPKLVLSNVCLSEKEASGYHEPRPISTLSGDIHLPFVENFAFYCYLSYPILFFHEYTSHIYTPKIDSRRFDDGWLMYAIELFMKARWHELCDEYSLIWAQLQALDKLWIQRFTRLAARGYELAAHTNLWIDNEDFFRFTWDLASYPSSFADQLSFHDDFLDSVKLYLRSERGQLLRSAAENSVDALELYERLRPGL